MTTPTAATAPLPCNGNGNGRPIDCRRPVIKMDRQNQGYCDRHWPSCDGTTNSQRYGGSWAASSWGCNRLAKYRDGRHWFCWQHKGDQ